MVVVYVLRSVANLTRYVGITDNVARRMQEHRRSGSTVAKQLGEFELIQSKEFEDYRRAGVRERFLKNGQGREWLDRNFGARS